jgi:hypothetical protein
MIALRVEWCRSRVRVMRYAEEVELLLEEMRRVLAFLEWDRDQWNNRALYIRQADADTHPPTPSLSHGKTIFEEGLRAYALRQASIRQHLFDTFAQQWHNVPAFIALTDRGFDEEVVDNPI